MVGHAGPTAAAAAAVYVDVDGSVLMATAADIVEMASAEAAAATAGKLDVDTSSSSRAASARIMSSASISALIGMCRTSERVRTMVPFESRRLHCTVIVSALSPPPSSSASSSAAGLGLARLSALAAVPFGDPPVSIEVRFIAIVSLGFLIPACGGVRRVL